MSETWRDDSDPDPDADIGPHLYDVSDPTDPADLSRWMLEDVHPELDSVTNFVHDVDV